MWHGPGEAGRDEEDVPGLCLAAAPGCRCTGSAVCPAAHCSLQEPAVAEHSIPEATEQLTTCLCNEGTFAELLTESESHQSLSLVTGSIFLAGETVKINYQSRHH